MFADEKIGGLDRDERLLFIGLITMADDEGRLRDLPAAIIGHVFPYDEDVTVRRLERWLSTVAAGGLIVRYESGGKRYIALSGWHHQKVNRPRPSDLPAPPAHGHRTHSAVTSHSDVTADSVKDHGEDIDGASPHAQAQIVGRDPDPDPDVEVNDARARSPLVAAVCEIFDRAELDPSSESIELALEAYPPAAGYDPITAAREVVTWLSEPGFSRRGGPATWLQAALRRQHPSTAAVSLEAHRRLDIEHDLAAAPTREAAEQWPPVIDRIRDVLGDADAFDAYIAPLVPISVDEGEWTLAAPADVKGWVTDRFSGVIAKCAGRPARIIELGTEVAAA
jgi:hypothetical protein